MGDEKRCGRNVCGRQGLVHAADLFLLGALRRSCPSDCVELQEVFGQDVGKMRKVFLPQEGNDVIIEIGGTVLADDLQKLAELVFFDAFAENEEADAVGVHLESHAFLRILVLVNRFSLVEQLELVDVQTVVAVLGQVLAQLAFQIVDEPGKERVVRKVHPEPLRRLDEAHHDVGGKAKLLLAHLGGLGDIIQSNGWHFRHGYSLADACSGGTSTGSM